MRAVATEVDRVWTFGTALGWMAVRWTAQGARCLTFGHASGPQALYAIAPDPSDVHALRLENWRELEQSLIDYAAGAAVDLHGFPLVLPHCTPFQRRVLHACRELRFGMTCTYAELAHRAAAPRAARAVGNVMARNPLPLLVPCHRVLGSGRGLGGYSGPQGVAMKRRLLQLEGVTAPQRS